MTAPAAPPLTDERVREIAEEIVLDHARDIEFLSVCERLDDEGVDDGRGDLARRIHDLAMSATVTVEIHDTQE